MTRLKLHGGGVYGAAKRSTMMVQQPDRRPTNERIAVAVGKRMHHKYLRDSTATPIAFSRRSQNWLRDLKVGQQIFARRLVLLKLPNILGTQTDAILVGDEGETARTKGRWSGSWARSWLRV